MMDIFVNIITLTNEEVPGAKLPNEPKMFRNAVGTVVGMPWSKEDR